MKRRRFLKSLSYASAGAAGFGILKYPRTAHAGWGDWPADKLDAALPADRRAQSVLEVYMYGGVTAFDSFYCVPEWGQSNQTFLNAYRSDTESRFVSCGFGGASELTEPFAEDENGTLVHLGPWAAAASAAGHRGPHARHGDATRPARARGREPRLSGNRLGSPRLAGLASISATPSRAPGLRAAPYAYVLYPGVEFPTDNVAARPSGSILEPRRR